MVKGRELRDAKSGQYLGSTAGKTDIPTAGNAYKPVIKPEGGTGKKGVFRKSEEEARAIFQSVGLEPLVPYPGMGNSWLARCQKCNREVSPRLAAIVGGQGPCKYCRYLSTSRKLKASEESALSTLAIAGVSAMEPYPQDRLAPWKVRCDGCSDDLVVSVRQLRSSGIKACPRCRSTDRFAKANDEARSTMVVAGAQPLEPFHGAMERWRCKCLNCGKEVFPRLAKVRGGTNPCQTCAYQATGLKHRNDADESYQEMIDGGFEPLENYPGINKPWRCKCLSCGVEGTPRLGGIRMGQGCSTCTHYGFNPEDPSIVYLIKKEEILKIGIANIASNRMSEHKRRGWEVHSTIACNNGRQALFIETAVLRWFRKELKAPVACIAKDMPQRGWTETISSEYVSAEEIWLKVQVLELASLDIKGTPSLNQGRRRAKG